jgi:SAM-dependent methyltransferase
MEPVFGSHEWSRSKLESNMLTRVLRHFGFEQKHRPFSDFLVFKSTLKAAKEAGLSVGDYIERKHLKGSRTALEITMEGMASLGVFNGEIRRVCEIGPGSGRYLEKIISRCHPAQFEIYETSEEWKTWLLEQHQLVARCCDGRNLADTESGSVDLVQAHKLLPGLPTLLSISYMQEMARIAGPGGWVIFDIMTEDCFEGDNLHAWVNANPWDWDWSPHIIPRDYSIRLFANRGLSFIGSFKVPLHPSVTECFVFRRDVQVANAPKET